VRRGTWDERLPAANGEWVLRVADLEDAGVRRSSVYRRCRPGGPWQLLLPGVVLRHPAPPTDEQRLRAALLLAGENAVLTGLWALSRLGLRRIPDPREIHVLVPHARKIASTRFVVIERTTRLPSPLLRTGLVVAPAYRAAVDAARRISDFEVVQAMFAEAVQRRRCTPLQLAHELEAGSRRGGALPMRALRPLLAGAESVAEADAWRLWKRSGLPPARWNVKVFGRDGDYIAKPDAWCDEVAFAWEIDSVTYHSGRDHFLKTLARNVRYAAAGIAVLQTPPSRLRTEPETVLGELRAAYAAAEARPRPPGVTTLGGCFVHRTTEKITPDM
jgi:hypothetical protein